MDQKNFSQVADYYKPSLLAHAFKLTSDEEDAKDLLQDTLIKAVRSCGKFAEGTNIRGWLYVIMKNTFYNNCSKLKRRRTILEGEEDFSFQKHLNGSVTNLSETKLVMEDIQKAMDSIRTDYRIPFQRYFEGYSYDEIASELDIPLGTVKTHIFKARHELKKYLRIYREN